MDRASADIAAKSAQHFSLKHERVLFTAEDTVRYTEKTIYHTEIAVINPHSVAKFCLSEFAHKKGFVVALTGEGADELLLGYSPFRLDTLLEMRSRGEGVKSRQLMEDFNRKETKGMAVMLGTLPMDTPR
jgi:asparagine synthase (glutamine-hydrolysing)